MAARRKKAKMVEVSALEHLIETYRPMLNAAHKLERVSEVLHDFLMMNGNWTPRDEDEYESWQLSPTAQKYLWVLMDAQDDARRQFLKASGCGRDQEEKP